MTYYYHSEHLLSFSQLFSLPSQELKNDWFQRSSFFPIKVFLAKDQRSLFFGAVVPGTPHEMSPNPPRGTFIEGLWDADVLELFLFDDTSPRYREFNLSPSGAWWMMEFEDYRCRRADFSPQIQCDTFAKQEKNFWQAAIQIPLPYLFSKGAKDEITANICAIRHSTPHGTVFFSFAPPSGEKPDFHSPRTIFRPRSHR